MKAVHFGAGNIGRGFVGMLLHEGGYELVFSDVSAPLVDAINAASEYTVHEVGEGARQQAGGVGRSPIEGARQQAGGVGRSPIEGARQQAGGVGRSPIESRDTIVTGFRAINSATHPEDLIEEIAGANVLTTAVGPTVLAFVAPHIVAGLALRDPNSPPLQIMACENAINATDLLRDEIVALAGDAWDALAGRAVFANTAVDRIVPAQPADSGIDVTVEPFHEWAIERPPFGDDPPRIPRAHFVDDLAPYIERKLFTVNTGHAATAYFGAAAGIETISGALSDDGIAGRVAAALEETSALLVAKHELDPAGLTSYRETILRRFRNPALPDTVWRVGRQPLRKLSRHERFVGPAAEAAERGLPVDALLAAMGAALAFDDPEDPQSVDLQRMLREQDAASVTASVTGLEPAHPLFGRVREIVAARQAEIA